MIKSMSVMGFQKKVWMGRGVGGVRYIQFFFDFFNFAKPLTNRCLTRIGVISDRLSCDELNDKHAASSESTPHIYIWSTHFSRFETNMFELAD